MDLTSRHRDASPPRVAVIGAGFGGLAQGVKLKQAGINTFTIFEKSRGVGGVWRQNSYPGAEVDTPSHWYSLSFHHFDWSRTHSRAWELKRYMEDVVDKFGLEEHLRLGTCVERLEWNEANQCYTVWLSTGETQQFEVVVSAVGLFNVPKYPDWPGLETFKGPKFHTARWEHEHDLAGKRVAVVGTGSTGAQVAAALAPQTGHLYVFQREPGWMHLKEERDLLPSERAWRLKPSVRRLARAKTFVLEQRRFWRGKEMQANTAANRRSQAECEAYINSVFKDRPDLRDAVTPKYPYFGKRPVKAAGFYETLLRDNVTFIPRAISHITETAVVDAAGEAHDVDVIVMATGFKAAEYLGDIDVVGRDGVSIHQAWKDGPEAFLGLTVPGFPNFYMLYGPNTNMGMIVFNLETQATYVVRDLKRMMRTGATALEVRPNVHRLFNRWLQWRLRRTVWAEASNYYKTATGKLVVPFPTAMVVYWILCQVLRWPSAAGRRVAVANPAEVAPGFNHTHDVNGIAHVNAHGNDVMHTIRVASAEADERRQQTGSR